MTTPTSETPVKGAKRRSWLRKLLFAAGGLILLLVVAYFVVTSGAFFKGVILPRASQAVGGQITVADASLSPFSQVHLRQLKVQTTGTEPLLQAAEVRVRYSLSQILRGTIKVDELTIASPVIQIIENADGSSNLDPFQKPSAQPAPEPSTPSTGTPQVDLRNVNLKDATVRHVKLLAGGGREVTELSGVNITLDQLRNGQPGKVTLAAALKVTRPTNDVLEARSGGSIEFTLGADLAPQSLKAKVDQEILRADGSFRELAGHRANFTADVTPSEIKDFALRFQQGARPLGELVVSGPFALATREGRVDLVVTNINLADWRAVLGDPLAAGQCSLQLNLQSKQGGARMQLAMNSQINDLAATLGGTSLTQGALSLKLNGQLNDFKAVELSDYRLDLTRQAQPALSFSGSAAYDGTAFRLQTKVETVLARLVGQGPASPLTAAVELSGSFTNQILDLTRLQLALAPTPRAATNACQLSGRIDLSSPALTQGRLSLKADTLDLTPLYDALTASSPAAPTTTPTGPATPPASAPSSSGQTEPDPVKLPLQVTAELALGQVYLRDLVFTGWQTTAKVDGSKVVLDPCRLSLNGAPVSASADVDLSVKGYRYALALLLDRVPLEPIANSFSPDTRGQYQGALLANVQLKGAGISETSLRTNLAGQVNFSFTNANIQLLGPKAKRLITPIATLLRVNEVNQSPLNWVDVRTTLGDGKVQLTRVALQSEAFEARTQGAIALTDPLTNSPVDLPLEFALRRSLAEKASLLPPNTPPDARYALLPRFVTVKGTVGAPRSDVSEMALGGLLIKSGVGVAEKLGVNVGGKTGQAIKGVGDLLGGQKPADPKPGDTNAPPKPGLLDLFKKK